jgi:hypothetical protein
MSDKSKKLHFISFADGTNPIISAGARLLKQSKDTGIFASAEVFNKKDLMVLNQIDESISAMMKLENHGFGFFIWKPLLIKTVLESNLKEGDVLVYTDSGTEIVNNIIAKKRFLRMIKKLDDQPVLAFRTNYPEANWTKRICLDLLNKENDKRTPQIEATTILLRKCDVSMSFVRAWCNIATLDNGKFIDLTLTDESKNFIEHREDQSIFSVLYKNEGFESLKLAMPAFYDNPKRISFLQRWAYGTLLLWPIRNRTGYSLVGKRQNSLTLSALGYPLIYVVKPIYKFRRFIKGVKWYIRSKVWKIA